MFSFRWFRSAVRNRMAPIPRDTARIWKRRLSVAYMLIGFNAMGFVMYLSRRDNLELMGDPTMSRVDRFKSLADGSNLTVVEIQGFTVKNCYDIPAEG